MCGIFPGKPTCLPPQSGFRTVIKNNVDWVDWPAEWSVHGSVLPPACSAVPQAPAWHLTTLDISPALARSLLDYTADSWPSLQRPPAERPCLPAVQCQPPSLRRDQPCISNKLASKDTLHLLGACIHTVKHNYLTPRPRHHPTTFSPEIQKPNPPQQLRPTARDFNFTLVICPMCACICRYYMYCWCVRTQRCRCEQGNSLDTV